jgi:hypothetical protein
MKATLTILAALLLAPLTALGAAGAPSKPAGAKPNFVLIFTPAFDRVARAPGEENNLAGREPQRVRELRAALATWRGNVGARMPEPNPAHDPARATELAGVAGRKAKSSKK